MITLIASLLGFLSSGLPQVMKYFQQKTEFQHELEIMDRQIEFAKLEHTQAMEIAAIQADTAQTAEIYKTYNTGVSWVDAFNGTVRPILTYAFFALYCYVKYMQFQMVNDTMPIMTILTIVWTVEDQALFSSIIAFYFGNRTFGKVFK